MNPLTLSDAELLAATKNHLLRSHELEADLLLLLGEIDARKLYAERAHPSMFAFCVHELGFSEDVACYRIDVARLARRFPKVIDYLRQGRIHLSGLRVLAPHVTEENLEALLRDAAHKSKREIEEVIARCAPRPAVAPSIRKLPASPSPVEAPPRTPPSPASSPSELRLEAPPPPARRPAIEPLAPERYRVEFTADAALKAKLDQAGELLRHRGMQGDLAAIVDRALDLLIDQVKKERFGVGRKPRPNPPAEAPAGSRHIPDHIKRTVYERDGGRCTFVNEEGRRCQETGDLEYDHLDGFARTGQHRVDRLALRCPTHNQLGADHMYGRAFMDTKRRSIRPGADDSATGETGRKAPLRTLADAAP